VQFVPYQYRPVLKLIRADRPRLLIADEVGVGKTIEAGLIIKELRARMDISSVLVICPKALVAERKWFKEMKRFDEHFTELNGASLRHCLQETDLEGEWPEQHSKAILPFSLFDSDLLLGSPATRGKRKLLSPARRRRCIDHVRRELPVLVSERRICRVLGQHRSTQRKAPRGADDEQALTEDVIALAKQYEHKRCDHDDRDCDLGLLLHSLAP
jgi:hypothetical protein